MDRNEAVLRELNLYPQWVRRNPPAPLVAEPAVPVDIPAVRPDITTSHSTDETTSHSTRLSKNDSQVAGYEQVEGHVFTAEVVRQAHHERPDEQTGINHTHTDSPAITPASQVDSLGWPELKQQVRDCTACKLRAGCTQTVFGVGDEKAEWLFVGEGPGADEDARGEPFVGQAGKLLDNMLLAIKLRRGKNVYIANIVKCRPPGNRTPGAEEIAACLPYLQRQIELIKPKLIVALGKTAATALLGRDATLGSLRGTLHYYRAPATDLSSAQGCESSCQPPLPHQTTSSHRVGAATPLLVTYHPAYLLRSPTEKAKAWQDLCLATDTMQKLPDAIQKL